MACDTVSISSDEDVPLKLIGDSRPITATSLKLQCLQHCDFCEEVFLNKYDALIHNAKHIIIPLMKRELHQCPLCLFYFTSRYKLKHHTRNKHKNDVPTNENVIKNDVSGNIENKHNSGKRGDKKENVNLKNYVTKMSNVNHVKLDSNKSKHEEKTKDTEKIVTIYESDDDDDDIPLVNGCSKGNHAIKDDSDDLPLISLKGTHEIKETESTLPSLVRDAILKDVKVVIEKIELPKFEPELPVNNSKVPDFELSSKINKINEKSESKVTEYEPLNVVPEFESKIANKPVAIETQAKASISPPIEKKAKTSISPPKVKITNRLRFEGDDDEIDDICDDAVMKDLTTECIVDMNIFDEPWFDELANSISNDDLNDDGIISIDDDDPEDIEDTGAGEKENAGDGGKENSGDGEKENTGDGEKENTGDGEKRIDGVLYTPSIHHDELIRPGVYRCKKCQQMFPTRFNQIQHEMTHMHIRKPRPFLCEHCDRFLVSKNSLKEHLASKHFTHYTPRTYKNCTKCGLKYNDPIKHLEIYHEFLRCHLCNAGFDTEIDRLNHIRGHLVKIKCNLCGFVASEIEINQHKKIFHKQFVYLAEFNLCDVCCLFIRNKHNTQYAFGETTSKLGSRLFCEHCGNKFFHLTKVRRAVKGRPNERFHFEKDKEKKKVLTNTERLKNIQQRLKMINRLSRF